MSDRRNVISFMNMKGGVGKTTICVNIAAQLAKRGKKVLVIDNDPQMNASQYMLDAHRIEEQITNNNTIYSLYKEEVEQNLFDMVGDDSEFEYPNENLIVKDIRNNLSLICGDLNMTKVKDDGTISDILNSYIENNNLSNLYDFIFIDCPPTQSVYTTSAFKASDFYIVVIKPDFLSTVGLSLFSRMLSNYNRNRSKNVKLKGLGIIANLTQKTGDNYHERKIEEIKRKFIFTNYVFNISIGNNNSIAKSSENQEFMYETRGCKRAIGKLVDEFLDVYNKEVNENV